MVETGMKKIYFPIIINCDNNMKDGIELYLLILHKNSIFDSDFVLIFTFRRVTFMK